MDLDTGRIKYVPLNAELRRATSIYVFRLGKGKYWVGSTYNTLPMYISFVKKTYTWVVKYGIRDVIGLIEDTRPECEMNVCIDVVDTYGEENVRGSLFPHVELTQKIADVFDVFKDSQCRICGALALYNHNTMQCKYYRPYIIDPRIIHREKKEIKSLL